MQIFKRALWNPKTELSQRPWHSAFETHDWLDVNAEETYGHIALTNRQPSLPDSSFHLANNAEFIGRKYVPVSRGNWWASEPSPANGPSLHMGRTRRYIPMVAHGRNSGCPSLICLFSRNSHYEYIASLRVWSGRLLFCCIMSIREKEYGRYCFGSSFWELCIPSAFFSASGPWRINSMVLGPCSNASTPMSRKKEDRR